MMNKSYNHSLIIKRDYALLVKSPKLPKWVIDLAQEARYQKKLLGQSNQGEKDSSSVYRTRAKIRELLDMNLNPQSRFITLTYKDNMMDYKQAAQDFRKMIDVINKRKLPEDKLKYLQVKEHQKRGAIHFHIVTFNMEELDFSKYWKHGFTHQKAITVFDSGRIANYFTSYLVKEQEDYKKIEKGVHIFGYSNNLNKYKKGTANIHNKLYKKMKSLFLSYDSYADVTISVINLEDAHKLCIEKTKEKKGGYMVDYEK